MAFRRLAQAEIDSIQERIDAVRGGTTQALSKWEEDFLLSIEEQFAEKMWLSDKQLDILTRIYDEKL